jgi:hypothetical protein
MSTRSSSSASSASTECASTPPCATPVCSFTALKYALKTRGKATGRGQVDDQRARRVVRSPRYPLCAGHPAMARPGLEPGTPRFSGSGGTATLRAERLQVGAFQVGASGRDAVRFGPVARAFGTSQRAWSPNELGQAVVAAGTADARHGRRRQPDRPEPSDLTIVSRPPCSLAPVTRGSRPRTRSHAQTSPAPSARPDWNRTVGGRKERRPVPPGRRRPRNSSTGWASVRLGREVRAKMLRPPRSQSRDRTAGHRRPDRPRQTLIDASEGWIRPYGRLRRRASAPEGAAYALERL